MEIFEIVIVGLFFSINIERRFFNFIYRLDEIYLIYIHNSYLCDSYSNCHDQFLRPINPYIQKLWKRFKEKFREITQQLNTFHTF